MIFVTDYLTEKFILDSTWESFPKEIQDRAVMCGIDLFGALILGSYGKQYEIGQRVARSMGMVGDIQVIGGSDTYNLLGATIVYGHGSNSFDIDDGYNMIKGHPGSSFVAGVLASAQQRNITCKEFLTTLVVCYEITIRWGLAMQDYYHYLHSSGTYGAFGTVAGVGRILKLDYKKMNTALSISDYHAPMVPVMRAVEYPSMNKDGIPFGAMTGMMAVLETLNGYTGKTHILEMPEYREYLQSLYQTYYIKDLYFKPYTCCRWAHQPVRACQILRKQYNFSYADVESVRVYSFEAAVRLYKEKPIDTDEAQYNVSFPVACALVYGDVGFQQVNDCALHDNKVLSMMDRISFCEDDELTRKFPDKRLARVEIILKNGKVLQSEIMSAPGEHDDPEVNLHWITEKFFRVTKGLISECCQSDFIQLWKSFENYTINEVVALINNGLCI